MAAVLSVNGPGGPYWPSHMAPAGVTSPRVPSKDGRFDQFALSQEAEGEGRFRMDLVSRLSKEVRAANTTGEIQTLHREVQAGSYRPDPTEIAARMLLMKGAEA